MRHTHSTWNGSLFSREKMLRCATQCHHIVCPAFSDFPFLILTIRGKCLDQRMWENSPLVLKQLGMNSLFPSLPLSAHPIPVLDRFPSYPPSIPALTIALSSLSPRSPLAQCSLFLPLLPLSLLSYIVTKIIVDKIGPVLAGNLLSNGITSFERLAETDPRLIEAVCASQYLC
jgi:hypothetical protein